MSDMLNDDNAFCHYPSSHFKPGDRARQRLMWDSIDDGSRYTVEVEGLVESVSMPILALRIERSEVIEGTVPDLIKPTFDVGKIVPLHPKAKKVS